MLLKDGGSANAQELIKKYYENKNTELNRGAISGFGSKLVPNRLLYGSLNSINSYYDERKDGDIKSTVEESYKEKKESPTAEQIESDIQFIKNEIDTRKGIEAYISQLCIDAKKNPNSIESVAISDGSKDKMKEMIEKKFPNVYIKSQAIDDIINSKNKEIESTKKEIDSQIEGSSKDSGGWEAKHYAMFIFAILISMICPLAGIVIFAKLPPINKDDNLYQRIKNSSPYIRDTVESMEKKSEELKSKPWGKDLIESVYAKKDDIIKNQNNKEELDKIINEAKKPVLENMKKDRKSDTEIANTSKEMDEFIEKINVKQTIDAQNIDEFKGKINESVEQGIDEKYKNDPNKDVKIKEEMEKFNNEIDNVSPNFNEQKKSQPGSKINDQRQIPLENNGTKNLPLEPQIGSHKEDYLEKKSKILEKKGRV
jgi:hypothetical protein